MLCDILILKLILFHWCVSEKSLGPLVQTNSGEIRGHYLTSYKGNKYEAYQGIPYALPPTGERRFQTPVPVEPWSDEMQAIKIKDDCLHDIIAILQNEPKGRSEDCLYLNVYVPTRKKTDNISLPVIFYIYGDGFMGGGVTEGEESYIIDYDVIFVSMNYRSGILGFLSTEDEVVPGNMGLKDQSMALRWVHDNIKYFGGDQNKITLLGGSSGGVCVQFHYLSPWSRGLFHAGISLSGTAFIPAAVTEHSREKTLKLGKLVDCTDNDMKQLVKCLRNVPGDVLIHAHSRQKVTQFSLNIFSPVVEKSSTDPFINDYPSEILKKGQAYDVPWLIGAVSEEGLAVTAALTKGLMLKLISKKWNSLAPIILDYRRKIPKEEYVSVAQKIREHYFGKQPINRKNLHALTKLIGDRAFSVGGINAAKAQAAANKSPVYFYYYTYKSVDSVSNSLSKSTKNLGVAHGDDVHLIIKDPRITPSKSPNDIAMQKRLIQICTSVAYNGVPKIGIEWPRVTSDGTTTLDYLHIVGPNNLTVENDDNFAQCKFWNSIGFDEK